MTLICLKSFLRLYFQHGLFKDLQSSLCTHFLGSRNNIPLPLSSDVFIGLSGYGVFYGDGWNDIVEKLRLYEKTSPYYRVPKTVRLHFTDCNFP